MSKIVIVGAGIAGMTAAAYAQKYGHDVTIYEKNPLPGGECMGWNRQGYHIDNCIHWVTGCRPTDPLYSVWQQNGALDDSVELIHEPFFYQFTEGDVTLRFGKDLEQSRKEFLTVAPEDAEQLNLFFDSVKAAETVQIPVEKSMAEMNFIEYMKYGMKMATMGPVIKEYGKDTIRDLANRFKNPIVKKMMGGYFDDRYLAITLLTSYGFFSCQTAGIPVGGSFGLSQRMAKHFTNAGGTLCLGKGVNEITITGKNATSITLDDNTKVSFDYLILATDPAFTFQKLLDPKYMDKNLKKMYDNSDAYMITSGFNVSFGVDGTFDLGNLQGSTLFSCEPYQVATQTYDMLGVRTYDYDATIFPKEKRVLQCNLLQNSEDIEYWRKRYSDKDSYKAEKDSIAKMFEERIVKQYPNLKGHLIYLDSYSPMTMNHWCNANQGAYMSFFQKLGSKSLYAKNTIKGLNNVLLASQWLSANGGLPLAATSGKFAAEALQNKL